MYGNFLARFWWALCLGLAGLVLITMLSYNRVLVLVIDERFKRLSKEETVLAELMKELQEQAFSNKKEGISTYHKKMYPLREAQR